MPKVLDELNRVLALDTVFLDGSLVKEGHFFVCFGFSNVP